MIAIAGGIVIAVIVLAMLGVLVELVCSGLELVWEHLTQILFYGFLGLVGLVAAFIVAAVLQGVGAL